MVRKSKAEDGYTKLDELNKSVSRFVVDDAREGNSGLSSGTKEITGSFNELKGESENMKISKRSMSRNNRLSDPRAAASRPVPATGAQLKPEGRAIVRVTLGA